jgi:hypothetical protein
MRYLLWCLFLGSILPSFGQNNTKSAANLFIHFDKNVYSTSEPAYFTAYLVKEGTIPLKKNKVLAIALIRNIDTTVVITKKFIMQGGIANGDFEIPDSLLAGNYRFLAYTDQLVNGLPEATFEQNITLKTRNEPVFKVNMKLVDEIKPGTNAHQVIITATTADSRFLTKPLDIVYRYGNMSRKAKTDATGQLVISLPIQNNVTNPNLYVKICNIKDTSFMQMPIPNSKSRAQVNFYPEGGHLVRGLTSTVAFEVKDAQRMPIALKAIFLKNDKVIDTLETDSYGIGKFTLRYEKDAHYTFKLIHDGLRDSAYHLPQALTQGIALQVPKAVANDTVRLQLRSTGAHQINIRIHNFKETFLHQPFKMTQNYQAFKIALTDMPKGLLGITITDSLDRPVAERIFFAHFDKKERIQLQTDRQEYKQREKVTLSLNLPDSVTKGFVSVAVVQNNRIELKKMRDIESYTYLNSVLADLPIHLMGLPFKDDQYIENALLTKGWRRYQWEGLSEPLNVDSVIFKAQVLKNNKALKTPLNVVVLGKDHFQTDSTSSTGLINLTDPQYTSSTSGDLQLFVPGNNYGIYQISIMNGFNTMSEQLKKVSVADEVILPSTLLNNTELVLKGNEKAISLKEVVIRSKADVSFNDTRKIGNPGRNACGDYVCHMGVFNCRNHTYDSGHTAPVKGQKYAGLNGPYNGCLIEAKEYKNLFKFDFVRYAKEFYENDYQDPKETAFFSTIYWNYGLIVDKKKTELSFYTSDITGKFKVVAQGILNNDVVYAEQFFEVNAKQDP